MFDTLQSTPAVPYTNEIEKTQPAKKPAIAVPVKEKAKKMLPGKRKPSATPTIPPGDWNLPVLAEGYIRGRAHDFLWR